MRERKVDKFFLTTTLIIIVVGVVMFISAALGILVRSEKTFYSILFSQLVLGLGLGFIGMYLCLKINYKFWRKYSFYIFLLSVLLTAAVFIPGLGWSHGGAKRWIELGPLGTFQPVEFLKFGFILYFAAWLSWAKNKAKDFKYGILPFIFMITIIAVILLKQPDTKSFILITITGISMLFTFGVRMRYLLGIGLIALVVLGSLIMLTPYLQKRVKTFLNPSQDAQNSSYQIQQSYIAIGSGGIFGRGIGQSIQKFSYLPEPHGDSIFAVVGEELGFVGCVIVILLYSAFALRGLRIANNSPDLFSRLLVSGIIIMIAAQSFMNIASITGVFPLTGVPLVFMSHGGTALMIYLMAVGIVLNISRFQIKK